MTEKAKGGKRNPNSIKHITDILKRSIVFLVCICLIGTNIPTYMILASNENEGGIDITEEGIFSMSLDSLRELTEKAVTDEAPLSEEIYEFSGSSVDEYEELFDTEDGFLYEIFPDLDEECDSLSLRTFARIKKSDLEEVSAGSAESADEDEEAEDGSLSGYNVTGNEEIIFLLINDTDNEASTRIQVTASEDKVYETKEITVPGIKNPTSMTIHTVESMSDAVYFVIDEKQENMNAASLRVESGSNASEEFSYPEDAGSAEKTEEPEGTGYTEEIKDEENAVSVNAGTSAGVSAASGSSVNVLTESASNASASAYTEGCVPMKGELYGSVNADGMKAVAFVTTMKDLGFEGSLKTYSLVYDGTDYTVTVEYNLDAGIPEDAELTGEEYDIDSDTYTERFEEAKELYGWEDGSEPSVRLFDVSLILDGEEIEPDSPVQVTFTFYDDGWNKTDLLSAEIKDDDTDEEGVKSVNNASKNYTVIHFGNDHEIIDPEMISDNEGISIAFEISSFSDIMVLANQGMNIVLNLGNVLNYGTEWDNWFYNYNYKNRTIPFRYAVTVNSDTDGNVTVNLPCDNDLPSGTNTKSWNLAGNQNISALRNATEYDYKLVGWYDIYSGVYYDVSDGQTKTITLNEEDGLTHVFYADWVADTYDRGSGNDADYDDSAVSTSGFVNMKMFDYNELFNMYSEGPQIDTSEGNAIETQWDDETYFYNRPFFENDTDNERTALENNVRSFVFYDNANAPQKGVVGNAQGRQSWNGSSSNVASNWNITKPDGNIFSDYLFDESGSTLGVNYVGTADYLFQYGQDETDPDTYGYYYYDSTKNYAVYNQSAGRFYLYNGTKDVGGSDGFFPYNDYTETLSKDNGSVNYWFGMSMEVNFYLPDEVGFNNGDNDNKLNDNDLTFHFSGDDDILIFVDDMLVLDLSGVHGVLHGEIDFATGEVKEGEGTSQGETDWHTVTVDGFNSGTMLSSGKHTLTVYYLERGANQSNLNVSFNLAPSWYYETGEVQAVTAEKTWVREDGTQIEPQTYSGTLPAVTVGLYDGLSASGSSDSNVYTRESTGNGYTYTYTFTDPESGVPTTYRYITTVSGGKETPVSFSIGDTTYSTVNDDGWIVDSDGVPLAKIMEDGVLWILMDTQNLNYGNNWYYAWDLLDADGTYMTMEISSDGTYKLLEDESTQETVTDTYPYWTVIGEEEIESDDGKVGITGAVILTDAAEHNEAIGSVDEAEGYVIVCDEEGNLSLKTVMFSQHTTFEIKNEDSGALYYYSECGVCSAADIEALGWGALWYLDPYTVNGTAGTITDSSGRTIQPFYLYCVDENEDLHYLTIRTSGETYSVITTRDPEDLFFYDSLGELIAYDNNTTDPALNDEFIVTISKTGSGELYIRAAAAGEAPDDNDVRFYTLNEEFETTVTRASYVNQIITPITIVKEDAGTEEPLANVSFTLQDSENELYYTVSVEDDETKVIWSEEPAELASDEKGKIVLYISDGEYVLNEIKTADGYNMLPSSILITVEDGKITAGWSGGEDGSEGLPDINNYITINDGEEDIIITVKNYPGMELPETGGFGTTMFTLTGLFLMSGSALLYLTLKRRKKINIMMTDDIQPRIIP